LSGLLCTIINTPQIPLIPTCHIHIAAMLIRSIGAALLSAGAANAFQISSPFLMLSTKPSTTDFKSAIISTADKVTDAILETVGDCAQSKYFIVRQPGLTLADLQSDASSSISTWADSAKYEQRVEIPSVMRYIGAESLVDEIASRCGATRDESRVLAEPLQIYTSEEKEVTFVTLPSLPAREAHKRTEGLKSLYDILEKSSPKLTNDYMIILVSAPSTGEPAESVYEMDEPYPSAMHQGLKRDIKYEPLKSGNRSMQDGLPLFEKYQFLSPGIFMGLTISLLLFVMLWIAVSAIAGLEVSYMAFSKEMGPAAQNKGKQQ